MQEINMKIRYLLPLIGIILLIYIVIDIGFENILNSILLISPAYFFVALVLIIPRVFLASYKWLIICRKQKMDISLIFIVKVFLISLFYGFITPASIGGYVSVYYLKKKANVKWEKSITNSLLDGSTEFIAGLSLALAGFVFLIEQYRTIFSIILFLFILCSILFIILIKKEKGEYLFRILIRRFIPKKLKIKVDKSIESFYEDIPQPKALILPFILEYFVWFIMGLQVYIIALSFSVNISFFQFLLIYMISFIAGILPISIGGLGIREGALVILLLKFGVSADVSFVISLAGYFITNLIPGIIGWFLSINIKPDLNKADLS